MEIQHFNSFKLSLKEGDSEKFVSLEDDLPIATDGCKKKFMAERTNELINKYEEFAQETRNGNHGKTTEYWMGYVDMLHLYREFSTGDLDLYRRTGDLEQESDLESEQEIWICTYIAYSE